MTRPDWIALLEASYDLDADDAAWSDRVLACAAPLFERSEWPGLVLARVSPSTFHVEHISARGGPELLAHAVALNENAPPEVVDVIYRGGATIGSLSRLLFSRHPALREQFVAGAGGAITDVMGVSGHTGTGWVATFSAPMTEAADPTPSERRRWPLAAAHVAAGLRLRRALSRLAARAGPVEAVLGPDGKIEHLEPRAEASEARASLRAAVRRIERARSAAGRRDPEAAMAAWLGLVCGRWSLVDRFEEGGRRFLVAVKNDPVHADPRGLTQRQRQVAEFVGLGRSNKEIAYVLGLASSTVSEAVGAACRKLGLGSRVELATFFSPAGVRARLGEVAVAAERLLVGSCPLLADEALERLTAAEQAVVALALGGSTDADIARRRGTSPRTVANQLAGVYRKLGVVSRVELAARVSRPTN